MSTLQELQDSLALYKSAEKRILSGAQEAQTGGSRKRLADLTAIQAQIRELEARIALLRASSTGLPVTHSTPIFGGRR